MLDKITKTTIDGTKSAKDFTNAKTLSKAKSLSTSPLSFLHESGKFSKNSFAYTPIIFEVHRLEKSNPEYKFGTGSFSTFTLE